MMHENTKKQFVYEGPSPTTRRELERLMKIAAVVGGLESAVSWLSDRLEVHEPEPESGVPWEAWNADKVAWVKWYRSVHGASLKEAVDEGRRRHEQS